MPQKPGEAEGSGSFCFKLPVLAEELHRCSGVGGVRSILKLELFISLVSAQGQATTDGPHL